MKIEIENCVYKVHPIYDLYAANENGVVINVVNKKQIGDKTKFGYILCTVRKRGENQKRHYVHRFVWECFNGLIPDNKVIDHINNIRDDNRLCNLQLVTTSENIKKSVKNRNYEFVSMNNKNKKSVKAINISTNEVSYYDSLYAVQQHLGINAGIVKQVSEKLNNCKTGRSKKDGDLYKFEYVGKDEMPDNYKRASDIRPKRFNEEEKRNRAIESLKKWQKKEFTCSICDKIYKNGYKYTHTKICERNVSIQRID